MSNEQPTTSLQMIRQQFAERLAAAPLDNEEETDEERAVAEEARVDLAAGRVVPWSQLRRKYS
jgi:hypothetical protein